MYCQHCNKRLSIIQRLKGLAFCSPEHQQLHYGVSFERLRASVTEFTPPKPPLTQAAPAVPEVPQPKLVLEPEVLNAAQEVTPTLEIASLVEAIGTATKFDLPEAPFLPDMPSRQDWTASPLKSYAEEPVLAAVQLQVKTPQKPALRAAPSRVLNVSPAQPAEEVSPIASQATWQSVPPGYPPVIVSASATLLLDSSVTKLIALPMVEACR